MTSGAKHTAGPWETDDSWSLHGEARPDMMDYRCNVDAPAPFTENEYGGFKRIETQTGAIAFGRTPEEAQANARLIAAAPELLAALEVLLEEATSFSVSGVYFDEECMGHKGPAVARAAIAKAEGGAK